MTADMPSHLVPKLRFPEFRRAGDWKRDQIGSITSISKGKGVSKADISESGLTPCIRYAELYTRYGEVIREALSHTDVPPEDLVLSQAEDIIVPASGETRADIARAACVVPAGVALGGDLNILRSDLSGRFFSYLLNSPLRSTIARLAQGDTVAHLYPGQLSKVTISYPLPAEQQKIADCLGNLDELIAAEGRKLEALRQHKQGLMQQLFPQPGETAPRLRFPEFRDAGQWEPRRLGRIGEFVGGGTPDTSVPEYWGGDIQWFTPTEIKDRNPPKSKRTITSEGLNNSSAKLLPVGTLLITTRASIGDVGIADSPCATNQGFQSLVVAESEVITFWYYWLVQHSSELTDRASGSTFLEIGKSEIKKISVLRPDEKEQRKIADCLGSLDDLIASECRKLEALRQHKQGLMQQLFPSLEGT